MRRLGRRTFGSDVQRVRTPLLGQPVPFSPHLTHTSFDGDSFSTVSTSTLIARTSWSRDIPAEARWLNIACQARDSGAGSGSPTLAFFVGPTADEFYALIARPAVADIWAPAANWIPCTNGDVYYRITASGTDTMDVYLYCWGYIP